MSALAATHIEKLFSSLAAEERASVISHGAVLRLSDHRKRLLLAESRVRHFEEKYGTTLEALDAVGLPDDAGYEMHEDYIMWHHWAEAIEETKKRVNALKEIAEQGLLAGDILHVGH